jgi:hypothetical protein
MSFPLENARLCMDCDTVFDAPICPSCSSESYFPLSRWIRPALEEIRPTPPNPPLREAAAKTARNASLLLAGSGLAYALWRGFMSKGRSAEKVEEMARRSQPARPSKGPTKKST